ncbi:MAG: hypothetical protein N4A31_01350, partial [Rickettsiales bacterium]|nr:hypothetical protein [Rickettsiales bacterium]
KLNIVSKKDQLLMLVLESTPSESKNKALNLLSEKPSPLSLAIQTEQFELARKLINSGLFLKNSEIQTENQKRLGASDIKKGLQNSQTPTNHSSSFSSRLKSFSQKLTR